VGKVVLVRLSKILGLAALTACLTMPHIVNADEKVSGQADVVVVGAGLAGLSAARSLVAHGYSVIVLEASDRVGGRTWTKNIPGGGWIDMGGQWVGPGMDHILQLADAVHVKTFPSFKQGKSIFIFDGKRTEYTPSETSPFPLAPEDIKSYGEALAKIDAFAAEVPVADPSLAPHADEWDSETVATWIQNNISSIPAQFLMRAFVLAYFASEPRDVSFLHFLFYIHAGGGFHMLHTSGVAFRFIGGAQQISEKVAEQLGDRVKLNMPVREIDQTGKEILVKTDHDTFKAKQVIVAMAPTLAARIAYKPMLSANRDQFTQRAPMGSSIKVHATYPTAFWREKGLSGQVISQEGDVTLTVDNSPPSGKPGIMVGFLEGQEARRWAGRSDADLQKMVLAAFVKYFGPQAAKPIAFYKANWDEEPWARGCFTGVLPPGVWTGFPGAVRKPAGRIHWAGTETATQWYAYMDGAVSSGERAANEIMQDLKHN